MKPRFDARWERRSADEIRALQDRKLREFLRRQVAAFSPFYRRLLDRAGIHPFDIRTVDDLEDVPFTTKEDIAPAPDAPDRPRELVLAPNEKLIRASWPLHRKVPLALAKALGGDAAVGRSLRREYQPISVFFTTGRTALPTAFLLSRYDLAVLEEVGRRIMRISGIDPASERIINLFPFAPHLAFWQVYYVGVGGLAFVLNTGGGKVLGSEGILQAIEKLRPTYIAGIPGYIYHILRAARDAGADLSFVKGLALGGDRVTPGYRRRVRELMEGMGAARIQVASVFGFTEARKCWTECPGEDQTGFHTYPDLEVMEIVDPATGRRVPEGQTGELVYTCLDGRGSAVLRYRTGDLIIGGLTTARCPACGRTVPRLASHLDRVSNLRRFQLSKIKGTLVNLDVVKETLENDPRIEEWQLVIRKRNDDPFDLDELRLNLALKDAAGGKEAAADIERKLFRACEVTVNEVKVLPLKELLDLLGMETQLKERRIADLRPGGSGPEAGRGPAAAAAGAVAGEAGAGSGEPLSLH